MLAFAGTMANDRTKMHRSLKEWARWALALTLVLYSLAMIVWQHQYLNSRSIDFVTLLSTTKDAFLMGRSLSPHGNNNNTIEPLGNNNNGTVLSHRPASLILQNPKLPDWVKQYAAWHKEQRHRYLEAKRNNITSTEVNDIQFLISRCLQRDKCGGASDRLQDMPYNIMLANQTNRVLLVRWEKPAPLENFLVPPKDGIDWTLQGDMYEFLKAEGDWNRNWNLRGKETDGELKIVSTIRRDSAAPMFRAYESNVVGHKM